jgi:ABC-type nitrate/sulfonate/bicarbonate transport system permease component
VTAVFKLRSKKDADSERPQQKQVDLELVLLKEFLHRIATLYEYNPLSLAEMVISSVLGVGFGVFVGLVIGHVLRSVTGW